MWFRWSEAKRILGILDSREIWLNEVRMRKEDCKTFWPFIVQTPPRSQ